VPRPPFFSIVVPTCDRPRQLAACLQSLARLDYPRDRFEVIVVDDGTTTAAPALVVEMKAGPDVRLVRQPHAGPAAARNLGASHARGSLLAFTDDDCAPAPDWLWALAARFERPEPKPHRRLARRADAENRIRWRKRQGDMSK